MNLTGYEKETIISFNEDEKLANVYTHNKALRKQIKTLQEERPDAMFVLRENDDVIECSVPKKWVSKLHPGRILSDEQKKAAASRMSDYWKNVKDGS